MKCSFFSPHPPQDNNKSPFQLHTLLSLCEMTAEYVSRKPYFSGHGAARVFYSVDCPLKVAFWLRDVPEIQPFHTFLIPKSAQTFVSFNSDHNTAHSLCWLAFHWMMAKKLFPEFHHHTVSYSTILGSKYYSILSILYCPVCYCVVSGMSYSILYTAQYCTVLVVHCVQYTILLYSHHTLQYDTEYQNLLLYNLELLSTV